ncbi:MAG: ABC transporter ATP-binding protein [Francisellaceae bacterium]
MSNTPKLHCQNVSYKIKDKTILGDINLDIPIGKISAIIGPNGSGKSTLLRLLTGLESPTNGNVFIDDNPLKHYRRKQLAQWIAFLPQRMMVPEQFSVIDLLESARHPYRGLFSSLSNKDKLAIDWALDITDMAAYQHKKLSTLSGGLQQRAWIAMVLAQQTPIIILDEPTTYLDIKHQLQLLKLIQELNDDHKKTIIWVLHDLNQACQYSDQLFVIDNGMLVAQGKSDEISQSPILCDVFDVSINAISHSGNKVLVFS